MNEYAPIALFTYKRYETTRLVVEHLLQNKECILSDLLVYSDGPRAEKDAAEVQKVRDYVSTITGFRTVKLVFRDQNLGLAKSFVQGITETFQQYSKAIFLEDDNLVSPFFLQYINAALDAYEHDPKVMCVTGYSWPLLHEQSAPYFVKGAETWSMATWKRGWDCFNPDVTDLLRQLDEGNNAKDFAKAGFSFYHMLQQQLNGEIDSWGARWWASAFLADKYCLYPHKPYCVSVGYGVDSVHNAGYSPFFRHPDHLAKQPFDPKNFPREVKQTAKTEFLLRLMNKGFFSYSSFFKKARGFLLNRLNSK